ncbi:TetR/AcrR family transcriptional regulator C-terminal domain-containing protein [Actinocrispum sp. NPDC049592]|uniref:TetR/AcrR family transcriptional regulator C-terminal domain-containing protein n=1 Tax=Actinocrispum sp. NPDC049592 TaxID=3154835 RepID=UPI00343058B2
MPLERDEAVRVALDLLDEVGLDGLSLRKLAAKLGVQAPTLYWHFKNKQDLIDEMAAQMMAGEALPPPTSASWDEWLSWMARNMRALMLAHRDGALLHAAARPAEGGWEAVEAIVAMLRAAGFSQEDGLHGLGVLTDYVLGATLEEQAGVTAFPVEDRVGMGIELILDGMRARLARA